MMLTAARLRADTASLRSSHLRLHVSAKRSEYITGGEGIWSRDYGIMSSRRITQTSTNAGTANTTHIPRMSLLHSGDELIKRLIVNEVRDLGVAADAFEQCVSVIDSGRPQK